MIDFQAIYRDHADRYDLLVSREDHERNLLPALRACHPLAGADVVELGAGTGRLTALLAPLARRVWAFDASPAMLVAAAERLARLGLANWRLGEADHRRLPAPDASADVALAGWTLGHAVGWHPDGWRDEIGAALGEMARVLRPGGTLIVIETLGTGRETPEPPSPELAAYYDWLETELDFDRAWIRTDYRFESVEEAEELTRFFFGDALADRVARERLTVVPECTGIWARSSPA